MRPETSQLQRTNQALGEEITSLKAQLKAAREALPEWIPLRQQRPYSDDGNKGGEVLWVDGEGTVYLAAWDIVADSDWSWMHADGIANLPKREPVKEEVKADPDEVMRKEFEAWAKSAEIPEPFMDRDENGKYPNKAVQYYWVGWKAAKKGAPAV